MRSTDTTAPKTSSDTLGIPERRRAEELEVTGELELGCVICRGSCAIKEMVLFWRIGEHFAVAHIDCALPPLRRTP